MRSCRQTKIEIFEPSTAFIHIHAELPEWSNGTGLGQFLGGIRYAEP